MAESDTGQCSKCNAEIGPEHTFCPGCGVFLDGPRQIEYQPPKQRSKGAIETLKSKYLPDELFVLMMQLFGLYFLSFFVFFFVYDDYDPILVSMTFVLILLFAFTVYLLEYRNWARYGLVISIFAIALFFSPMFQPFTFFNIIVSLGSLFVIKHIGKILFLDKKIARLFTIDWQYDDPES